MLLSVCCVRIWLQLIEQDGTPTQFLDASNRFYTLIPHDFGMKKPPLLDSADAIRVCSCFSLIPVMFSALQMLLYCGLDDRQIARFVSFTHNYRGSLLASDYLLFKCFIILVVMY